MAVVRAMKNLELRHLESLCQRLGIDTHEIDQTLTYRENKHILLERFGIHDQKHNRHLAGYIERLQDLAENWRGCPKELMTEPSPISESLDDFEAEIIGTSQPVEPSQSTIMEPMPQDSFEAECIETIQSIEPAQSMGPSQPSGPFVDWRTVFPIGLTATDRPTTTDETIEAEIISFVRLKQKPDGSLKVKFDLLGGLAKRLTTKQELRLWC